MPDRKHFKTARFTAQLRQGHNDWYRIENRAADVATVHIYDEIGYFGVSAADFITDLHGITARNIDLRISSPGGSVFDGFAIFEALRAHPATVTTYVDSLAASIASVIALAGDRVVMGQFAEFMIHEANTIAIGNADDLREVIEDLDRESARIASVYAAKAGGTVDEWRSRMKSETWFSADEAVEAGLADEVSRPARQADPEEAMAAKWDLSVFAYAGRENAPPPNLKRARPAGGLIPQLRDGQAPPLLVPEAVPVAAPLTLEQVAAAFGLPLNQAPTTPEGEPQAPDDAPADGPGEDGDGEEADAHDLAAPSDDTQPADDPPAEESVAEAAELPGDTSPEADVAAAAEPAINVCVQQSIRSDADVAAVAADPLDEWADLTAHLLETLTPPSSDDVLAAFREALL